LEENNETTIKNALTEARLDTVIPDPITISWDGKGNLWLSPPVKHLLLLITSQPGHSADRKKFDELTLRYTKFSLP